jgi:hypothetical protein
MALNHVQRSDAVAAHSRAKRGFSGGIYMRSALGFIAAGVLVALTMDMAVADGTRRSWRVYRHGIGAISRDVITPWYVGYYPSHYSYFCPDPMPPAQVLVPDCWHWGFGYRYWACW